MEIGNFEVGTIKNGLRTTVAVTTNYRAANKIYKDLVYADMVEKSKVQNIIFLFDYNKNTNIDYYDSNVDRP